MEYPHTLILARDSRDNSISVKLFVSSGVVAASEQDVINAVQEYLNSRPDLQVAATTRYAITETAL